jgi:molybdopterin converting factor subunit 1
MSIRVLFFASLADIVGMREAKVAASDFADIQSIYDRYARDFPLLEGHRPSVFFSLNSEFARPNSPVRDGDEVAFFPPVSGG